MTCALNPLMSKESCGARYQRAVENPLQKEFAVCIQCGEGKNNLEAYQKEHERLNHLGGCDNCGTEGHIESIVIDGKTWHLCGVCRIGVWRARKAGAKWEDVKDEIKERSLGVIIKGRKHIYSFERENKEVSYGTGKCGICGLEMTLSYKLKDGRLVDQWCYNKRRSAITASMDLKEAEKEIAEAHAMVVQGKGTGPLSWEKERELKRVQNRKEAEKKGLGKVKTKQSVSKQEQKESNEKYEVNENTFESLEKLPVPAELIKPWNDPRIPEFLKADENLLSRVVKEADDKRQTVIGLIMTILDYALEAA